MSNYKKAFNFQNGVQVDDDNFVVTQGGLVGIGTSVPSKTLDVRGNADISGILTTSGMNVGAAISVGSNIIIDAASGIITATKFIGEAGNLSGIVAISTDGFITQAGSLSTTAKVGIKTDNPVFDLQIGLNPRTSIGVGITNGDVLISGVTTTGNLVVSGLTTTKDLFASGVSTFTGAIDANDNLDVDGHTELDDLNVSGISTFGGNIDANVDLDVDGHTELDDVKATGVSTFGPGITTQTSTLFATRFSVSGVSTFEGNIDANADLDVDGDTTLDKLTVDELATFTGIVSLRNANPEIYFSDTTSGNDYRIRNNGGTFRIQQLVSGNYDTRFKIINNSNQNGTVEVTGDLSVGAGLSVAGISTFADDVNLYGNTGVTSAFWDKSDGSLKFLDNVEAKFGSDSRLEIYGDSSSGSVIKTTAGGLAEVITAAWSVSDGDGSTKRIEANGTSVDLYFSGSKKFETTGVGASVYGQLDVASLNGGTSGLSPHFGSLRYGNESGAAPYSTRRSLDLINTDSGNINYYINANNLANTGDFHWHKGFSNAQLMTLTGIGGSLGIGVTQPILPLHVGGAATVTGNLFVGANLTVGNDLTLTGTVSAPNASFTVNSLSANQVTGNLVGNVNAASGFSTVTNLEVTGISTFESLSNLGAGITIAGGGQNAVVIEPTIDAMIINDIGQIGIRTDAAGIATDVMINASEVTATFGVVGVGTTRPDAAIDFRYAGTPNFTIPATAAYLENRRYMYPPKLTTAERNNLVGLTNGAMIYNSSGDQLQIYINGWVGIGTIAKVDS